MESPCPHSAPLPVLHQADLPLAGDLLGLVRGGGLHGALGGGDDHALGQAGAGAPQLVGGHVSGSSWGTQEASSVKMLDPLPPINPPPEGGLLLQYLHRPVEGSLLPGDFLILL